MLHQFLLELAIKAISQASLEGQATLDYKAVPYANATKWQHWGIFNTQGRRSSYSLQHCIHLIATTAQILVLRVCMLVVLENRVNRCSVSCARSAKNSVEGEYEKNKWGTSSL